jgi:hypothetical protein
LHFDDKDPGGRPLGFLDAPCDGMEFRLADEPKYG